MVKTLCILHVIVGLDDGGTENTLFNLCNADRVNRNVVISLTGLGKYGALLDQSGIEVYCLGTHRALNSLYAIILFCKLVLVVKPDICLAWMLHAGLFGGFLARSLGVKNIVWNLRNSRLGFKNTKLSSLCLMYISALISWFLPKRVICCSKNSIGFYRSIYYRVSNFTYIPNGICLAKFVYDIDRGLKFRRDMFIDPSSTVLGLVARYDPCKDHQNLIHALSILKSELIEFKLVLVGANICAENKALLDLISCYSLQDYCYLLGQQNDICSVMNSLDFHVLSSNTEAFPNVIAQAMACGVPCITTDVGDASFIVANTGWIVPHSSPVSLASAIRLALLETNTLRQQRGLMARKRIETLFSLERMVEDYSCTYNSLVN